VNNSLHSPTKKMRINENPNKIQTQNKDAGMIEDARLLRIGRKDTRNRRSTTKTQDGAI
jgi:hypothetical protein